MVGFKRVDHNLLTYLELFEKSFEFFSFLCEDNLMVRLVFIQNIICTIYTIYFTNERKRKCSIRIYNRKLEITENTSDII